MGGLSLDLPEQLAFYGSYHSHPLNQLIHFFCVPAILWSLFVWISAAGPLLPSPPLALPAWLSPAWAAALQPTNPAFLSTTAYSAFYLLLDPFAGASWALVVGLPLAWTATAFSAAVPRAQLWALAVHVLGWYLQIHPGHAVLERRKPALMDSLVQALFLLGYRPELREQLKRRVAELITQMDARRQPLTAK
ncbi:hypothetical protein Vretifemale_1116 [Volvox reticuliferus]|uniref:DUF962 domain-containing protein n=1 Tax=Volvox reticuliferus TaxID=1737510 RepID=A0A8J4BX09_9CHLO|nr:hypothetical protein Vretifemale_1116 [Volvox reticuliferus]